jgi:hypothetical protein
MTGHQTIASAERHAQEIIADIASSVLDSVYEEHSSTTFIAPIDSDDVEQTKIILGRQDDFDADESELGFDYLFRAPERRNDPRVDTENICGSYGWSMNARELIDEAPRLRQLFSHAVEKGHLDESELDRYDKTVESLEDAVYSGREETNLDQVKEHIERYDIDGLKRIAASDDEDGRVLWQLLFSKDENDDIIENDVSVEFIDNEAGIMFVRSERYFHDEYREPDGKWYAYGAVIGFDDTDDRFFVHRLQSDTDLRDPEFEWTLGAIKEKMGFDLYYDEAIHSEDIPFDNRILVQGDVALLRRDYTSELWSHYENKYEQKRQSFVKDNTPSWSDDVETTELSEKLEEHFSDIQNIRYSKSRAHVNIVGAASTDEVKELQEELNISEETVREEQDRRGIGRLSAKQRRIIVQDLLNERVYNWALEITNTTDEKLQEEAEQEAVEEFENTRNQVNLILGNHTLVLGPALEHPNQNPENRETPLGRIIVPEEATGYIWHDEHENKKITLPKGVYEFHFLDGHEEQFWMN